ncbi:hypothetical protein WOLCODRAFT_139137 [Wolfiporia cocos MD-104 SS10]|uniref:Phosphatidic acid phosphatase type 2/haloperoxidase domain-containing protein n=1 Tax=Wolfiporia cocos (strain MD-104) TaxID=742152 RepID=A0A2H3K6I0_WOLCO|nr:hypothetical protein WOLCODRAFT_139137 [Wolfiporia cocos MD-104 SS10]
MSFDISDGSPRAQGALDTVDLLSYADSSRSTTPDPADLLERTNDDDGNAFAGIGLLPEEVYDRSMNRWRAAIRRRVRRNVEWESNVLAKMQKFVRRPALDVYFVYTSSLGTHTFFMISLPTFVFLGYGDTIRGLLMVLAFGVYAASFVKDTVCSPRPLAPPVTRLTIGSHHLEYGFPSTHATNSVSIALFCYTLLRQCYESPASAFSSLADMIRAPVVNVPENTPIEPLISATTYYILSGVLLFYVSSIVYGRLYTGMHSFTDCIFGVALGAAIWAVNLVSTVPLHAWITNSGWVVPGVTVPLCLLMVHWHPQPVDDCPCFEDAIAFISVIMGEILSRWYMLRNGYDDSYFVRVQPGQPWGPWYDALIWWSVVAVKMIVGILVIFMWRIFAKTASHLILPPIFRLLAQAFTLPRRRFYTPATDYKNVPPEKGLNPIPSVIDLPRMMEVEMDGGGATSNSLSIPGYRSRGIYGERSVKQRGAKGRTTGPNSLDARKSQTDLGSEEYGERQDEVVKHYDADVLTKVIVYCGIGMLACGVIPVMFEALGWGLRVN